MRGARAAGEARRICLVCEVMHAPYDEGIRIFAAEVARALAPGREMLLLAEKDSAVGEAPVRGALGNRFFLSARLSRMVRTFRPDTILYVPWTSITARSLLRLWVLRRFAPAARAALVALQPRPADALTAAIARLGRPDVVFAAGPGSEAQSRRLGIPTQRVAAGVDADRFRPATHEERQGLRRKAGIDPGAFVLLHVGHLKDSRNVGVLEAAARLPGVSCLLVASSSTLARGGVGERLAAAGVAVMTHHHDRIELVYRLADAYLFPVMSPLDAIEIPLSVLEAAATDLAIVTTPFGGLPDLLGGAGGGVTWAPSPPEMLAAVQALAARGARGLPAGTRALVKPLTWQETARALVSSIEEGP